MQLDWLTTGIEPKWIEQNNRSGGTIYETYARNILKDSFELRIIYITRGNHNFKAIRILQFIKYILTSSFLKYEGDIVIRDVYSTAFAAFDTTKTNIVIFHHIDRSKAKKKKSNKFLFDRFIKRVISADCIIVVSEYWKKILEDIGCKKVRIIYNSFDLNQFRFTPSDLSEFRRRIGLDNDKDIVYLGNARLDKGFLEAYDALKGIDCEFVATGRDNLDFPFKQFYLHYGDYIKLLAVSSVVLTMSKFEEGWCRTAHEAMLCGTPVIGSGKGGMKELLEGGGQMICDDFSLLKSQVEKILEEKGKKEAMGLQGKKFASRFSLEYFEKSWKDLIFSLKK